LTSYWRVEDTSERLLSATTSPQQPRITKPIGEET
jgi:hypothetical protein